MAVTTLATVGEVFGGRLAAGLSWSDVIYRRCLRRVAAWIAAIFAIVPRPFDDQAAQLGRDIFFSHDPGTVCQAGSLPHQT